MRNQSRGSRHPHSYHCFKAVVFQNFKLSSSTVLTYFTRSQTVLMAGDCIPSMYFEKRQRVGLCYCRKSRGGLTSLAPSYGQPQTKQRKPGDVIMTRVKTCVLSSDQCPNLVLSSVLTTELTVFYPFNYIQLQEPIFFPPSEQSYNTSHM